MDARAARQRPRRHRAASASRSRPSLGLPSSGYVSRAASYDEKSQNWGVYLQDDWRLNDRLTVNLGLRWEYETPLAEVDNRSVRGFDAGAVQSIEAAARARYAQNPTPEVPVSSFNVRGGLTFAGVDGQPTGLYYTPKNNFMPRVGLTFKLDDRTVVRSGYGMFYGFLGQRRGDVFQSGFSANTNIITSADNGLTFLATLSNPFPNGITEPLGSAQGIATFLGQSVTFFDPNPKSPRTQRWQVGVQRELPGRWTAEASYVGNFGSQLQTSRNLNATPAQYLSTSLVRDQDRINYLGANVPNPFFGLLPSTAIAALQGQNITRERLLRPYPEFDAVNSTTNEGRSWYHSLQLNLQAAVLGRLHRRLELHLLEVHGSDGFLSATDPEPWEGIVGRCAPPPHAQRHRRAAVRTLPPVRRGCSAVVDAFIGGWQLSGIFTYQSGFPLGWEQHHLHWDLDAIGLPASRRTVANGSIPTPGSTRRRHATTQVEHPHLPLRLDNVRSDTLNNIDLSLIKNTSVAGKTSSSGSTR